MAAAINRAPEALPEVVAVLGSDSLASAAAGREGESRFAFAFALQLTGR
jgi:hypothetical protein